MPRRLSTLFFSQGEKSLIKLCKSKNLNEYETEIIVRIYAKKQSLNFIADMMEFDGYGRYQKYYSVRTINSMHKEAFLKLMQ